MIFPRRGGGGWQRRTPRQPGRHLPSPVLVAVACEVFALVLSVGANLAAVWTDGALALATAGVIPLVMIGATYLFLGDRMTVAWQVPRRARPARAARWYRRARPALERRAGAPGWAAWWANLTAAIVILVPVASASYWHQRELLIATTSPTWIATLLPLAVDGLALRAALTLFRLAHQPAATAATPVDEPATGGDEDLDEPAPADLEDDDDDEQRDEIDPLPLPAPDRPTPPPVVDGVPVEVVARAVELVRDTPSLGRPTLKRVLELDDSPARRVLRAVRTHLGLDEGRPALRPIRGDEVLEGGEAA